MNEPRTLTLLYESIEREYAWRITELSNFRAYTLQTSNKNKAKNGMIRAGVALLYAHWEGFIKKSADLYCQFVAFQGKTIGELNNSFVSIVLRGELENLQKSKRLIIHTSIINKILNSQNSIANFSNSSPIRTSNLRYDIFEDICLLIGVSIDAFHERYRQKYDRDIQKTINNDLVDQRNSIAHGEFLLISEEEYKELYNVIVKGIMYSFKELIMDSAYNKQYLRTYVETNK